MTTGSETVAEFVDWLAAFLPNDYYENYREYRWDIPLRRAYQRAAFETGWLQPTWPREHGGRSLGLRDAMEIRIEGALRSVPKLPNIQGPGVAAPGIRQFGTPPRSSACWCRCCAATNGGRWVCPSRRPGRTSPACAPAPSATVMCSGSTVTRSGPRRLTNRGGARCMPAPIRTRRNTVASRA